MFIIDNKLFWIWSKTIKNDLFTGVYSIDRILKIKRVPGLEPAHFSARNFKFFDLVKTYLLTFLLYRQINPYYTIKNSITEEYEYELKLFNQLNILNCLLTLYIKYYEIHFQHFLLTLMD
jgi:hypothetical protein